MGVDRFCCRYGHSHQFHQQQPDQGSYYAAQALQRPYPNTTNSFSAELPAAEFQFYFFSRGESFCHGGIFLFYPEKIHR